jgi:hypothetical protein
MNGARGEVTLEVGGEAYVLCLTLGALAEMESALGCDTLAELQARLKQLSAADLLIVLAALMRGGGWTGAVGDIAARQVDLNAAARAVGEAFSSALR